METSRHGQITYQEEADILVPEGCIAVGNEHGACMDRGCRWCFVYYDGPRVLIGLGEDDDNPALSYFVLRNGR